MVWQREEIIIDETIWDPGSKDPAQGRRKASSAMTTKIEADRGGADLKQHQLKKREVGHLGCPKVKLVGLI